MAPASRTVPSDPTHAPLHHGEAVALGKELEPEQPGVVGAGGVRYQAKELTLGDRGYIDDLRIDGMLHAALHQMLRHRARLSYRS